MNNILITGGGGFIGSHIAEYFANANQKNQIVVVDNLSRSQMFDSKVESNFNWNYLQKYQNIVFCEEDIRDYKALKSIFKKRDFDIIFHAAGQTAVTKSLENPFEDFRTNVIGAMNLLENIRKSNSEPLIIYTSSNKVYGTNINKCDITEKKLRYEYSKQCKEGISEDFNIDGSNRTPYGTSKLSAELYFQEFAELYGLNTGIFRMSCIYGPRQFGVEAQGWISHIIISAIKNKLITIFGDGKQVRDVLFISDLINAFTKFINTETKHNRNIFCIGGGKNNTLSILELIKSLEGLLNKKIKVRFSNWRPFDQKIYVSDIRKMERVLDWKPMISPIEGLQKTVFWIKENIRLF